MIHLHQGVLVAAWTARAGEEGDSRLGRLIAMMQERAGVAWTRWQW